MVDLTFMTYDDDDGMWLGDVKWPVIPRKGETIVLDGLVARKNVSEKEPPREEVVFVVDDVIYRDDMNGDPNSTPDIEIWLSLPSNECVWTGTTRPDNPE